MSEKLIFGGEGVVKNVDISQIHPNPHQPRKTFEKESLEELAVSIKNQGVLQPILVEQLDPENYGIVAGERRYRACQIAGVTTIPVIIKSFSNLDKMEVSLIENVQREDLNPMEEAYAYMYLLQASGSTQEELSKKIGKSRSTIANSIRLTQLPQRIQDAILDGKLTSGHARALLSVVNPADQEVLFQKILKEDLSVRAAEKIAGELNKGARANQKVVSEGAEETIKVRDDSLVHAEERFMQALGTKVEIKGSLKKGKIEIAFTSEEDLERIWSLFVKHEQLFTE